VRLGGHTITVIQPTAKDPLGDYEPGTAAETTVEGCYVQSKGSINSRYSREQTDLRDTVITELIVYAPPGADIRPTSRIQFQGIRYQVEGEPAGWDDGNGRPHHLEVSLRRVEG
jgi:hypothetical protein